MGESAELYDNEQLFMELIGARGHKHREVVQGDLVNVVLRMKVQDVCYRSKPEQSIVCGITEDGILAHVPLSAVVL
jgi:hypothetical protein